MALAVYSALNYFDLKSLGAEVGHGGWLVALEGRPGSATATRYGDCDAAWIAWR
jgi:hypothetical protein